MHLRLLASDITSPHPSPCQGEGAACHCEGVKRPWQSQDSEMQKHGGQSDVQHDVFSFVKRTYRLKDKFSSRFTLHSSLKKRAAFTLAEVLITLGIIGVVAALTIPALINNTQNRELQAALKKGYSQLAQALELMKSDLGEDILPQNYPAGTFKPIYCKYFKSLKNGLILGGKPDEDTGGNAMVFENYKTYNLSQTVKTDFFDDGQFILSDGTLIMIENPGGMSARQIYITIDVNGMNKKPNVYGRDLFTFQITNEGKFLPMGAPGTGFTDENLYCSKDSNNRLNGIGCAAKALSDPDYFKKY